MCLFAVGLFAADELTGTTNSIPLQARLLEMQSQNAKDLGAKKRTAEALCRLATKVPEMGGASNVVRLSVIASACESYTRYLRAIPFPSVELVSLASSEAASNSVSLLETALTVMAHQEAPVASLNVSPPAGTPGVTASGMDPKNIRDPKLRAEYEQLIAKNKRALDEVNEQVRLKNAVVGLREAIKNIVSHLSVDGHAASVRTIIMRSQIPPRIKADILDGPSR